MCYCTVLVDGWIFILCTVCDLEEKFQVMSLEENHAVSAMQNEKDKFLLSKQHNHLTMFILSCMQSLSRLPKLRSCRPDR